MPQRAQPPHIRKTPPSLCRTLHMLRTVGRQRTQEDIAEALGWSAANLGRIERADEHTFSMEVQHLERFQAFYGIPFSVICAVSQILEAARDRKPKRLEVLGLMLGKLSERLTSDVLRDDLTSLVYSGRQELEPENLKLEDWDNLLGLLIMQVWGAAPYADLEAWKDPHRLELLRQQHGG